MVLVSAMHITASVFVNDHESGVWQDILAGLAGPTAPRVRTPSRGHDHPHDRPRADHGAAHLRSLTAGHEVIVPASNGRLALGAWQRIVSGEGDGRRPKRLIIK